MQRHRVVRLAPQGEVREGRTDTDPARTDNARSRVGRGNGALAAMLPGPPTPHCFAFSGVNPKQQNKTKPTTQQATTGASSAIRSASAASSSLSARSHAAPNLPLAALHNIVSSAIPMSFCCFQLSLLFLMPLPICRLPLAGHCTCALQESRTHKAQPPLCAKLSSISSSSRFQFQACTSFHPVRC